MILAHEAPYKLGIDLGGPCIVSPPVKDAQGYRHTTLTPDALRSVRFLIDFCLLNPHVLGEIHFISQCTPDIEAAKRELLPELEFFSYTGAKPEQIHFCRKPEDKASYCIEAGIDYLIEDRLHVMEYALPVIKQGYLFASDPAELKLFPRVAEQTVLVSDWVELIPQLLRSFYS